jgi:hypothetical protein
MRRQGGQAEMLALAVYPGNAWAYWVLGRR